MGSNLNAGHREPWNKGKIVGQKAPFKVKDIWALRARLQMEDRVRELALFNLGIDSKLRGATSSASRYGTSATATRWHPAPWCCSTRLSARFSSRSQPQPATLSRSGLGKRD